MFNDVGGDGIDVDESQLITMMIISKQMPITDTKTHLFLLMFSMLFIAFVLIADVLFKKLVATMGTFSAAQRQSVCEQKCCENIK